uniref:Uncharacterized protein n=1 Tax=Kalanchoe fedtschenkoi TaxID=63787 RepID=A0A7N0UVQ0_KALFE
MDEPVPSTTLLPLNTQLSISAAASSSKQACCCSGSNKSLNTPTLIALILITFVALTFAFLYFSTPTRHPEHISRSLKKLTSPVVLLVSSDGFRFGYHFKTPTPNIHRLITRGTQAEHGLISVFPTLTFPNHYSIATGLYPAHHGIVHNHFTDPNTGRHFNMASHDAEWWLGEPLWETVANHGLKAATYFWPGSEVTKGSWNCPSTYCKKYNESVPFEDRVDEVLRYFDLPAPDIPVFMTLYFEDPDHQGHEFGPDAPEITQAVTRIDTMIGRLMDGLDRRGVLEDVHLILVGDHGMVATCDKKVLALDDLAPWIDIPGDWVQSYSPLLSIRPPEGYNLSDIVAKMNGGLASGRVVNGKRLKVYLKEDLPGRLHYAASDRIPPIIGLLDEGFMVEQKRTDSKACGGSHGYDNAVFSMRTIFIGHGPQFARGRSVPSFENVEIYNVITSILNIEGAPNNGTSSFPKSILLSK